MVALDKSSNFFSWIFDEPMLVSKAFFASKIKLTNYPLKKGVPGSPLRSFKTRENIVELLDLEEEGEAEEETADWS